MELKIDTGLGTLEELLVKCVPLLPALHWINRSLFRAVKPTPLPVKGNRIILFFFKPADKSKRSSYPFWDGFAFTRLYLAIYFMNWSLNIILRSSSLYNYPVKLSCRLYPNQLYPKGKNESMLMVTGYSITLWLRMSFCDLGAGEKLMRLIFFFSFLPKCGVCILA